MASEKGSYYVPESSRWPIVGSIALFVFMMGVVNWSHGESFGPYLTAAGFALLVYMMFGWFGDVIHESRTGMHSDQMDLSYRWGMSWFIFSEIMFFAAFFGALFYCRFFAVSWLGGTGTEEYAATHSVLWPNFVAHWPLLVNPDNNLFKGAAQAMGAWGLPAINTLILLTSGATITWAHWGLKKNQRQQLALGLFFTVALGVIFLCLQAYEYHEAYHKMGLTLGAGIYGSTFFMLTGFHGLHVTIGTIMLIVIWLVL